MVPAQHREYGRADVRIEVRNALLEGVVPEGTAETVTAWMSHGDTVLEPPPGFQCLATTSSCPVAAMAALARGLYVVQFHPEVAHTPHGGRILENFLFRLAGLKPGWSMDSFIDQAVETIRARVGGARGQGSRL